MNSAQQLNILSLEDSVLDFELIREQLNSAGYVLKIARVENEAEFVSAIRNTIYDIILADFKLPGFNAFKALQLCNSICPDVPFVCVSGMIGEETAAEIIKNGAVDYVLKDKLGRLPFAIERALQEARDKISRRKSEIELSESEQNYRTLADSGQSLIWAAGTDKRCNYFNQVWLDFTGRTLEQELGNGCINGIHPDDVQRRLDICQEAFGLREKFSMEYRLLHHDGEYRWVQDYSSPRYTSTGEFIGYIGQCLDITGRKQADILLQQKNAELLKLNTEKDKFFSIIAHDLRSPFNAFLGLTRMMEEDLPTFSLDELQKIASTMRKSANMLFHLLENLLEWSRMQRGLSSFKPESFLLLNRIASGIDLVYDAAVKKNSTIRYDIPENLTLVADIQMFESLIRNLVFNAVKFTPSGGEITVSATINPENSVQISIRDTGIGMSKEIMDKLFILDDSTNRKGTDGEPSTGLGLMICKDFVEKHKGRIWAESIEGIGSTFYFTIPRNQVPEKNQSSYKVIPSEKPSNKNKKLKVLIAEDDETSEMLITIVVKKYSSEILIARTGSEAVNTFQSHPDIDLIMMDIKMPIMDGYQATRLIRLLNTQVVIIAQTAFEKPGDYQRAIETGCNEYITKPLNLMHLNELIKKHFK